eukprot:2254005-Pleurochrysis_carterae.AAC.1
MLSMGAMQRQQHKACLKRVARGGLQHFREPGRARCLLSRNLTTWMVCDPAPRKCVARSPARAFNTIAQIEDERYDRFWRVSLLTRVI